MLLSTSRRHSCVCSKTKSSTHGNVQRFSLPTSLRRTQTQELLALCSEDKELRDNKACHWLRNEKESERTMMLAESMALTYSSCTEGVLLRRKGFK
jgi:hypothetical protein